MQVRPQLEQAFGRAPGGLRLLQTLMAGVKTALLHGLQEIFLWSAIVMTAAIALHLMLRREPLRARVPLEQAQAVPAAH